MALSHKILFWQKSEASRHFRPSPIYGLICLCAFLLIFFIRRPSQFTDAYVWFEEGVVLLPLVIEHGAGSIFIPFGGYLSISSNLTFYVASLISFTHLPLVSFLLTLALSFFLIWRLDRQLITPSRGFFFFLAAFALVPSDPEVLGITQENIFLIGLFAVLSWWMVLAGQSKLHTIDHVLIVVAILSSPIAFALFPLYTALLLTRKKTEAKTWGFGFCALAFVIQLSQLTPAPLDANAGSDSLIKEIFLNLDDAIAIFLGYFINVGAADENFYLLGLAILGVLIGYFVFLILDNWRSTVFIYCALGLGILLTWYRIPGLSIHPELAGPRYFFYPWSLVISILLCPALMFNGLRRRILGIVGLMVVSIAVMNNAHIMQRHHLEWDWAGQIRNCVNTDPGEDYWLMIFRTGKIEEDATSVRIDSDVCRTLVNRSIF